MDDPVFVVLVKSEMTGRVWCVGGEAYPLAIARVAKAGAQAARPGARVCICKLVAEEGDHMLLKDVEAQT